MSTENVAATSSRDHGTVLVTGGSTGLVGSHSIARLITDGYRVRVTPREPGQQRRILAALQRAGAEPADRLEFAVAQPVRDGADPA
ncbi:hypothetical protein [Streptomyces canus]|uniref:hypothetical protein n=1 Tax=Streptomyces canus TaxID=58343 RepID=UPI0030E2CDE9